MRGRRVVPSALDDAPPAPVERGAGPPALPARGERVSDPQLRDVLHARDQVPDLARGELVGGHHLRGEAADVVDVGVQPARHRSDRRALAEHPVDHADVGDHASVLVELRVEDQRAGRRLGVAGGRGHAGDQLLQHLHHARAGLAGDAQDRFRGLADQLRHFARHPLGLGAGEVELVQAGDQLEARVHREVGVGDGLRLHALGGVHHQQRALAGGQRARHLVGEVHVPGGVDQVQLVGLPGGALVEDPHRLRLDRDAALALQIHRVEHLRAHLALVHGVCQLEDPVRERGLAVVDVRDDREVADVLLVHLVSYGTPRGRRVVEVADALLVHADQTLDWQAPGCALSLEARRIAYSARVARPKLGNAPAFGPAASPGG